MKKREENHARVAYVDAEGRLCCRRQGWVRLDGRTPEEVIASLADRLRVEEGCVREQASYASDLYNRDGLLEYKVFDREPPKPKDPRLTR